jgi:2,3-bisphosphoglycerate-independent phosphoglycerate mutase
MKYIVLIPDGAADLPRADLNGRTPLQAAAIPNMDELAAVGELGLVRTVPRGLPAGSDVANMCVLGYDPHEYYTGRAPLEAASLGIDLAGDRIAFRCNLVNILDGNMNDFTAGHIDTEAATSLIETLQQELGDDKTFFHPGLSYRHILVTRGRGLTADCTPPHDITGKQIDNYLPLGEDSDYLRELMHDSTSVLRDHPANQARKEQGQLPANMIWLWGQGTAPSMPTMKERFGLQGGVITAVDLVKGLGKYAGLEIIDVPGATGYLDTNFRGKADYALEALKRLDFVYIHVEAPDEAAHSGDTQAKVRALEQIDYELLGPLRKGLDEFDDYRLLILPDHATPLETMTHTDAPVPFILFDSKTSRKSDARYDEEHGASSGILVEKGWELIDQLLSLQK